MLMTCWETSFRLVISIDFKFMFFTSKRVLRIWQNPQGSCHFKPAGNLGSRYLATLNMTALPSKSYLNSRTSNLVPGECDAFFYFTLLRCIWKRSSNSALPTFSHILKKSSVVAILKEYSS